MKTMSLKVVFAGTKATPSEELMIYVKEPTTFIQAVKVGEDFEVDEATGYQIMAKYPGCVEQLGVAEETTDAPVAGKSKKSMKSYSDKSAHAKSAEA